MSESCVISAAETHRSVLSRSDAIRSASPRSEGKTSRNSFAMTVRRSAEDKNDRTIADASSRSSHSPSSRPCTRASRCSSCVSAPAMKSAKAGNVAMLRLLALHKKMMPRCCFWAGRRAWLAAACASAAAAV